MTLGKTSFDDEQLLENYQAIVEELIRAKPSAAKGKYIRSIVMASTHGPRHQGRPVAHPRPDRGGGERRGRNVADARARLPPKDPRLAAIGARSPGQEEPLDRDQKAAVIDEVAGQISGSEAVFAVDYRGISVPQAAELRTQAARGRRLVPGRQEHADRARRRPGRRRGPEGAPRGPDGDDVRARRRRGGRQGAARLPPRAGGSCSPSRAAG